jgi:hypothetical protein
MEGKLTQLDNVANNSHDQEAHADGLGNAQELALVGCERKRMLAGFASSNVRVQCVRACVLAGRGGACSTRLRFASNARGTMPN